MLACSKHACVPIACILTLRACRVSVCMCKCPCRSVSVCTANVVEVSVCKCKCRSVSVQGIFRKNPSQFFREKHEKADHQMKIVLKINRDFFTAFCAKMPCAPPSSRNRDPLHTLRPIRSAFRLVEGAGSGSSRRHEHGWVW